MVDDRAAVCFRLNICRRIASSANFRKLTSSCIARCSNVHGVAWRRFAIATQHVLAQSNPTT